MWEDVVKHLPSGHFSGKKNILCFGER